MRWYKASVDLKTHPKRYKLERELKSPYGLHYIHLWFSYVASFSKHGEVGHFEPEDVARACEWAGDAQVFWAALQAAGFVEKIKPNQHGDRLVAHDWFEENGRFIRENEKRTGGPKAKKKGAAGAGEAGKAPDPAGDGGGAAAGPGPAKPPKTPEGYTPGFLKFWAVWPVPTLGQWKAFKIWTRQGLETKVEEIVAAVLWQRKSPAHLMKEIPKFIPQGWRWLDERKYLDQAAAKAAPIPKAAGTEHPVCPNCGERAEKGLSVCCMKSWCDSCFIAHEKKEHADREAGWKPPALSEFSEKKDE